MDGDIGSAKAFEGPGVLGDIGAVVLVELAAVLLVFKPAKRANRLLLIWSKNETKELTQNSFQDLAARSRKHVTKRTNLLFWNSYF